MVLFESFNKCRQEINIYKKKTLHYVKASSTIYSLVHLPTLLPSTAYGTFLNMSLVLIVHLNLANNTRRNTQVQIYQEPTVLFEV